FEDPGRVVVVIGDEWLARRADRWMNDLSESGERGRVGEHDLRQTLPVERAAAHTAREKLRDPVDQPAAGALELADDGVGIEDRGAGSLEHRGDGRLAHADGAGEGDADHVRSNPRSRRAPSNGIS